MTRQMQWTSSCSTFLETEAVCSGHSLLALTRQAQVPAQGLPHVSLRACLCHEAPETAIEPHSNELRWHPRWLYVNMLQGPC